VAAGLASGARCVGDASGSPPTITRLVAPEYRPTLGDELAALAPPRRRVAIALLALAALLIVLAATRTFAEEGRHVVRKSPFAYNFRLPDDMRLVAAGRGEWLRAERRDGDRLVASFAVEPLRLPPYRGNLAGALPVIAARQWSDLRARFPGLKPVEETKARVNLVAGYTMVFKAAPGVYGRVVLLPRKGRHPRAGVRLVLLSTHAAGAEQASDIGVVDDLKLPYRTFRYGTEGP
jgi:hypothetical protein